MRSRAGERPQSAAVRLQRDAIPGWSVGRARRTLNADKRRRFDSYPGSQTGRDRRSTSTESRRDRAVIARARRRDRPRRRERHPDEVEDHEGAAPARRAQHDRPRARRRRCTSSRSSWSPWSGTAASRSARTSSSCVPERAARRPGDPAGHRARRPRRAGRARPSAGTTTARCVVMTATPRCSQGETPAPPWSPSTTTGAGRAVTVLTARGGRPVRLRPHRARRRRRASPAIVEQKDATAEQRGDPRDQQRHLRLRRRRSCADALARITNDNAKGEYYLTDVVAHRARRRARRSARIPIDDVMQTEGVNDRVQLAALAARAEPPHPGRAGCATA